MKNLVIFSLFFANIAHAAFPGLHESNCKFTIYSHPPQYCKPWMLCQSLLGQASVDFDLDTSGSGGIRVNFLGSQETLSCKGTSFPENSINSDCKGAGRIKATFSPTAGGRGVRFEVFNEDASAFGFFQLELKCMEGG